MAQNFDTAWKEIEKLQKEGKYRSALEKSEALYQMAADDGAVDHQLRALFHRVAFTQQLEEDGASAALALLQTTLAERADNPLPAFQAVNHYALGRMLLGQLENYNRRPSPTTEAAEDPDLPIAEWPNERLVSTAADHLLQALEMAKKTRTALAAIPAIVRYDKSSIYQAPTLYELLVYEVLAALNEGYAYLSEPVYAFRPTAQQLFSPAADFINTQVDTRDTSGLHYRSMRIYQDLLANHPPNSATFAHANLQRLEWAFQQLQDEKAFYQALQTNYPKGGDAQWLLRQARLLQSYPELGATKADGSLNEEAKRLHLIRCRQLAKDLIKQFPNSYAAHQAEQLIQQLELPNLQLTGEEVVVPDAPILLELSYRNIEQIHYRLVRLPHDLPSNQNRQTDEKEAWTKLQAIDSGSFSLAKNDDLQQHSTEFNLKGLAPGKYGLLLSSDNSFNDKKGAVGHLTFTVSQLALVQYKKTDSYTGLVLDRQSGAAIPAVKATFYKQTGSYDKPKWKTIGETTSGQDGHFRFQYDGYNTMLVLEKGEDKLITNYNQTREYTNDRHSRQTHIFLDRGIYRPGQTVYFKGLVTSLDPQGRPSLLKGEAQSVRLLDVNGQEVGKTDFTSDDFGAFDGQFILPATGLNGMYRIEASGAGSRSFRVEAYKRPRFEVVFEPNDEAIEAGDTVSVTGKALGFAGPAVAGATVTYRVERKMPSYYRWWWGGNDSPDAILASGTTQTNEAGAFTIQFPALLPIGQKDGKKAYFRPAYSFEVYVDVADVTGETHAATTSRQLRAKGNLMNIESPSLIDATQPEAWNLSLIFQGEQTPNTEHKVQISLQAVTHPDTAFISRRWAIPDRPILNKADFKQLFPHLAYAELADIQEWASEGEMLIDRQLSTAADTSILLDASKLATGHYRLQVTYLNEAGENQEIYRHIRVLNTEKGSLPPGMLYHLANFSGSKILPGEEARLLRVAKNKQALVLHQWHSRAGKKEAQSPADKKQSYNYQTTDADRGGLQFSQRFVAYNRVFEQQISFAVPWPSKELDISLATFRDKLRPGEAEEWTMKISQHDGSAANAQVLASMYDAALDQLTPFAWNLNAYPNSFYAYEPFTAFQFGSTQGYGRYDYKPIPYKEAPAAPRLLTEPLSFSYYGGGGVLYDMVVTGRGAPKRAMRSEAMMSAAPPPPPPPPAPKVVDAIHLEAAANVAYDSLDEEETPSDGPVNIRTNLQETAFWYPNLRTEDDGTVALSFNSPEALSRWKFQLLAHTPDLAYATASREVVTQKELMIVPNAPRFLREGDRIVFTAKVSNLSEEMLAGTATLELFDPVSLATYPIGAAQKGGFGLQALGEGANKQPDNKLAFALEAGSSEGLRWEITVPQGAAGELGYRVIARSEKFSDGEQNVLPVLSNRIFLTATKPFFLRAGQQKTITLEALAKAGKAQGQLEHKGFSFELTNDPSWLVVKSLPYLMEYPYDCTEQLANRFFANQLSYTIVDKNPAFRAVFEAWKQDPDALKSPLALNQDLKQALLEETPWLREAADESEQKERLAVLFDVAKLADELESTLAKLENRQHSDGSYAWFPDGPRNRYMTQYVAETMTRLYSLKALEGSKATRVQELTAKTLGYLDFEVGKEYLRLQKDMEKKALEDYLPSSLLLHYLYIRSAEIGKAIALEGDARKAVDFYLRQAKKQWTKYGLHEQALLAIIFANTDDTTGELIIESLRERAIRSEELGMYWKYPRGFYWQQLPVETHSRLIEAFSRHQFKAGELDEMRLYLLQNKRTNRWETTKSTAAAAYAFLQTEGAWLQSPSQQKVKVKFPDLPKATYAPVLEAAESTAEAGTGYYRAQWAAEAVSEQFAKVEVNNKKGSVAWGGLYWQFMQDIDAVQAANESPMTLKRRLFRRITTEEGQKLEEISSSKAMRPGERLVVQLVIQTDRDMEYIHLKDRRAASLEPTNQLSQYRYEGGLGFYFSPDDLAVHYFIDYLPRGTYTLEYDLFVNHAGDFSNGLSVLQSMYAPEFSAYSDGSRLQVE